MARTTSCVLVNLCMIRDGTKVLVEDKIDDETRGIIFPGGHVEDHESLVDSVIREVKEETGLDIEHPVLCGIKDWVYEENHHYIVFLFVCDEYTGVLKSSNEGEVFWVEMNELSKMNTIWYMDEMIEVMTSDHYSEVFLGFSEHTLKLF